MQWECAQGEHLTLSNALRSLTEEVTFEPLCKAKNKNFPGGLWGRGNARPIKSMCKENYNIHRPVAPVWLKALNINKITKNLKEPKPSKGIFFWCIYFLGCFSLLSDISLPFLFLAGGDWAEKEFEAGLWRGWSGKSQGVWGPVIKPYCRGLGLESRSDVFLNSWSSSPSLPDYSKLGMVDWTFLLTGNPEVVALQRFSLWLEHLVQQLLELVN